MKEFGSFTFGEPQSVLGKCNLIDLTCYYDGLRGYYPPLDLRGLTQIKRANAHHGSCLIFRKRELALSLQNNEILNKRVFLQVAEDFLNTGNGYFQLIRNRAGKIIELKHLNALKMRVKKENTFCWLNNDQSVVNFMPGEVWHVKEYNSEQDIYGIPDWIGAFQSILLNEDATLFRRKYFKNGCHLGYVFYSTDSKISQKDVATLREQIANGKGAGNFRSLFVHSPNGHEKGIQILPIGDISQKDEFLKIKETSANDVMAAHRVPGDLAGIIPTVGGKSSGDIEKIQRVYRSSEVLGLAQIFMDFNRFLGDENKLKFKINDEVYF